MCSEEKIKAHTRAVEIGEPVRYRESCPSCLAAGEFRPHDCRPRTFRVLVEGCVKVFRSGIFRWMCKSCGKRFTDYPRLPCRTSVS